MSPIADMSDSLQIASVLKPYLASVGINACILADSNLSIVMNEGKNRIAIVLSAKEAEPIAHLILRAGSDAKTKSA